MSRDLCFCFKKRPLYCLWAFFLMKWTKVAPSSQDSAKKNQFQINSWRNKPMNSAVVRQKFVQYMPGYKMIWTFKFGIQSILCIRLGPYAFWKNGFGKFWPGTHSIFVSQIVVKNFRNVIPQEKSKDVLSGLEFGRSQYRYLFIFWHISKSSAI